MEPVLQLQLQCIIALGLLSLTTLGRRGAFSLASVRKALHVVLTSLRREVRWVRPRRMAMRGARPWWEE